jgi:hypothetical protein
VRSFGARKKFLDAIQGTSILPSSVNKLIYFFIIIRNMQLIAGFFFDVDALDGSYQQKSQSVRSASGFDRAG